MLHLCSSGCRVRTSSAPTSTIRGWTSLDDQWTLSLETVGWKVSTRTICNDASTLTRSLLIVANSSEWSIGCEGTMESIVGFVTKVCRDSAEMELLQDTSALAPTSPNTKSLKRPSPR